MRLLLLIASATLVLAGCGDEPRPEAPEDRPESGISGHVLLGPQCPVEDIKLPCPLEPAADVPINVSGDQEATTETDANGRYRIALPPGDYVVTGAAGMLCDPVEVHVSAGAFVTADLPCDTGIR